MEVRRGFVVALSVALVALVAAWSVMFLMPEDELMAGVEVTQDIEDNPTQWQTTQAYPALTFKVPVDIQPGQDGRVYVVEQAGVIKAFEDRQDVDKDEVFLDIRQRVSAGGERGLLGLAFDPNHRKNGRFYVNYTSAAKPLRTIIARFDSKDGKGDPDSETILMEIAQPYANHNGGQIAFGPDGMLYISVGDGGSGGDPHDHGQNRATLLGNILRIDVGKTNPNMAYAIPPDNPFAGNKKGWRQEIWAWGLRNVWRFSFDSADGRLWAADVGQNAIEEVNVIKKGGNYGWAHMEGLSCYKPTQDCQTRGLEPPVVQYSHKYGVSITGGYVYRGKTHPKLQGAYIYGDFASGRIWALRQGNNDKGLPNNTLLTRSGLNISTFGLDTRQDLLIAGYRGQLHRLAPR